MSAAKFPPEILAVISTFLTINDKLQCSIVCRNWRSSFQYALWHKLEINWKKLHNILNAFSSPQNIYENNGHLVNEICWTGRLEIGDECLYEIQHCFQNIRKLDIRALVISNHHFGVKADWNLWSKLTFLTMKMPEDNAVNRTERLLGILKCLPRLVSLDVLDDSFSSVAPYTWETLEGIHEHLPRLEYITLKIHFCDVPSKDIRRMVDIKPAKPISSVRFLKHNLDFGWTRYLGLKYPNASVLESKTGYRDATVDISFPQQDTLTWLPNSFKGLQSVDIQQLAVLGPYHQIYWKALGHLVKSTESLTYVLGLSGMIRGYPIESLSSSFDFSSNTLKSLTLIITLPCTIKPKTPISFGIYSCLKDLDVDINQGTFELDDILASCVSLKDLRIRARTITLRRPSHLIAHDLEKITLVPSVIGPQVLEYLSFCCRKLTKMVLRDALIPVTVSEAGVHLDINMSFTEFQQLNIHNVEFRCQTSVSNRTSLNPMRLVVIEQTHPEESKNQDPKGLQPIDHAQIWFYQYCEKKFYRNRRVRILEEDEVRYAQAYFETPLFSTKSGNHATQSWKDDLVNGYITLKCKYVQKYFIQDGIYE
ncbi:hypothetical protein CLU79DRAFT_752693 [Phycomyces nitens]|nr:hypothetical protein CLU79DRAFT_752693 [Phycomyces nitens]